MQLEPLEARYEAQRRVEVASDAARAAAFSAPGVPGAKRTSTLSSTNGAAAARLFEPTAGGGRQNDGERCKQREDE